MKRNVFRNILQIGILSCNWPNWMCLKTVAVLSLFYLLLSIRESYATMPQVEKIRIIVGAVDKITAEVIDIFSSCNSNTR